MKRILLIVIAYLMLFPSLSDAQIGYQVSLLNTATGEPRTNATVDVAVSITNSDNDVVYSGNQRATTNDFGILSLAIGDDKTLKNIDWNKQPFFISATVDGVIIGKSQILNVPLALQASRFEGAITKKELVGTWKKISDEDEYIYMFNEDGTGRYVWHYFRNNDVYDEFVDFNWFLNSVGILAFIPNPEVQDYSDTACPVFKLSDTKIIINALHFNGILNKISQ